MINSEIIQTDILQTIKHWIGRILLIACIVEMILFPSEDNLLGCVSLVYGWFLISSLAIKREYLEQYVLPTLVMFGLGFCYCFLPIVVTLLEGKPLTFNFQVPTLTFINQMLSMTVISLAFQWAIRVYRPGCWLNRLWNKVGYMTTPNETEIWVMGVVGLVALLTIMSGQGEEHEYQATGNTLAIITKVFSGLTLAPICLYFKHLYGDHDGCKTRRFVKYYIIVLMLLGIATTRRMLIFNSIVTVACIYLFLIIYNNRRVLNGKHTLITIVVGYLVIGPFADMAMAMILNRQFQGNAGQTFSEVVRLYQDKEALHSAYQMSLAATDNGGNNDYGWSEYYVDNIFLDRFCNLRTIDGTLYNAKQMGFGCHAGQEYYKNFWINELPGPLASSLGLQKNFYGTATDHMVVNNFGDVRYSLYGCKVGGETGIGLWMFDYWYYPIALVTYFVMFFFLCSFVNTAGGVLLIPIHILISFRLYWMFFLNANGIFSSMGYVFTRGNLNDIFIYCIFFFVIHKLFGNKQAL